MTPASLIPKKMTPRLKQILEYLTNYVQTRGFAPCIREIGAAVGLSSSSTVHTHLRTLEKLGKVRRNPNNPRSVEVVGLVQRDRCKIAEDLLREWVASRQDLPHGELEDKTAAFLEAA